MSLKFAEFWMLVCFSDFGIHIGMWWAERIHYPDLGVGAWLGGIAGLAFAIFFMLPISNETARWKMKMLFKKPLALLSSANDRRRFAAPVIRDYGMVPGIFIMACMVILFLFFQCYH